ncbi:beta-galactosidase [Emticicia sp. W12TSBA100-4]|uniref:beta-galactosidase n=1 Tax=Emticicia sp. W12TSBA100-4 TaxID=3160965 RepID=UPI003305D006
MSIQSIAGIGQVCSASINPARVEEGVYFYETPKLGMTLYRNQAKTTPFGAGFYALKFGGKTYKVQTDSQGVVTVFDGECNFSTTQPKRFIAYMPLNDWQILQNLQLYKDQMNEMVDEGGVNFLCLTFQLSYLFQSWDQLNSGTSAVWGLYDQVVDLANSKNLPVGFRVHMAVDDNYVPNFYGFANSEKDEWGFEQRVYYGDNTPSFAYAPGVNMIQTFLRKIMDRYYPVLGNKLYYVSPTLIGSQEFGGNMFNQQYPDPQYFALFDYNELNQADFRNRMQTKYGTMQNLKDNWGPVSHGWNDWSEIQVPKTGLTNRFSSNLAAIRGMMSQKRGRDWWLHQYNKKKEFFIQCKNIVQSYNSNILTIAEYGSCNREDVILRLSFNVPDICTYADVVKTDFSSMTVNPVGPSISADYINSLSTKPKWSEIADFDASNVETTRSYIRSAFDNGLVFGAFIISKNPEKLNEWTAYKQLVREIGDEYKNKDTTPINWEGTVNTTMSECLSNWPAVEQRWRDAGGSPSKHVRIILTNDL